MRAKSAAELVSTRARGLPVFAAAGLSIVVCFATTVRRADAAMDGALLRFGSEVLAFPGSAESGVSTVRLNGNDFSYRIQTVSGSVHEVWRHYARTCSHSPKTDGTLGPLIRALATRGAVSETHGYVACIDLKRDDLRSVAQMSRQMADTWDLSHLGALRYVYFSADTADPSRIFLFTSWADGPLDLRSFVLQPDKDAPGVDLPHIPRPPDSFRILSFEQPGRRLAVYRVPAATPTAQAHWYRRHFESNAWRLMQRPADQGSRSRTSHLLVAEAGSRTATVILSQSDGGSTLVMGLETEAT